MTNIPKRSFAFWNGRGIWLILLLAPSSALLGISSALAFADAPDSFFKVIEGSQWYADRKETIKDPAGGSFQSQDSHLIDIRAVGDAAWVQGMKPPASAVSAISPQIGKALQDLGGDQNLFSGDLNFLNWEAVVGTHCDQPRRSVDFFFLSHPENIRQAFEQGFNLFGMANNHSQDCNWGRSTPSSQRLHGPLMTASAMGELSKELPLLWHGVGKDAWTPSVSSFTINGKSVRVALGSVSLLGWNIPNSASINISDAGAWDQATQMLEALQKTDADLKILTLHTQDRSGHNRQEDRAFLFLKRMGQTFIQKYDGDLVFGHGPHTWGGVKVVDRPDGSNGVIFTSLGNFIHQGLKSNPDNYIGKVLWNLEKKQVAEVQAIPFTNQRTTLQFYSPTEGRSGARGGPPTLQSNFEWQTSNEELGQTEAVTFRARFLVDP